MRAHRMSRAALGIVAAALMMSPAASSAEARVDWMNTVNVSVNGETLRKTGGCNGCDDAGAVSRQAIWRGDGYVEFVPGETNTFWLAGLSHGDSGTSFEDIDFAFRFNGAGRADVMENGVYQNGGDTTYAAGDVFRVAVIDGRVKYFKNGQLLRESSKMPAYPLSLDTALGSVGTTVRYARIAVAGEDFFDDEGGAALSRFEALDTNDDGRIERYEWPASRESFEAQDLDRNGVLTWGELSAGPMTSPFATTVEVDPRQRLTDTGIWVTAGDRLDLQVATARNPRAGALMVSIGESGPFLVGDRDSILAPATGRLYLGVSDGRLADASGRFRVHVTLRPRY